MMSSCPGWSRTRSNDAASSNSPSASAGGNLNATGCPLGALESFDFAFNPTIRRQQLYDLATCEFIRQHRNALLCGQTGVGKSHLAHALAHEAARKGFDVVFTTAHQLLVHVNAGRADGSYEKRLATYLRPPLLVVDDFGLKPLPPSGPADLYDIIKPRATHCAVG